MRFLRSLLLMTTAAYPAALAAQEASADETGTESANVAEIIVTAQRREQALQDVPLSVTAITAQSLDDRGVRNLADFANGAVQGLQVMPFAGTPSVLSINARGIGIQDPTQGTQELPVPLYIDGVPLGRAQGLGLELIDPERIEFLRGPQGQLFGRNAEGGAVQFVSRRPRGDFDLDARFQVGNFGLDSQRVRVDLPEFANIRLQASFARTQHDGFTKNSPTKVYSSQRDFGELDSIGFRVAAEWNPTDTLRVSYAYDNARIDDTQAYLTWAPVDIVGRPPFSPQPAFNGEYPKVVNSPTFQEGFRVKSSGHALTLQFEANEYLTLKSITSYRESSRHGSGSLGDALVAGGSSKGILTTNAREDIDQDQTYQELQILGSWDRLDVTVGGTYFQEKVVDRRESRLSGAGFNTGAVGLNPASLFRCIGLELCTTAISRQNAQSDSYGLYGQFTYTPPILNDRLELTAGVRYSDDKKVAVRTYIQPLALPPYVDTQPSGPLPPPGLFRSKRWDPAFTAKYNFTDAINAYFRYATGYRSGGVAVRSSSFAPYREETVKSYEIGFKSRFLDNRLTFNVAAYQNDISGYLYSFQEAPTLNPALTNTLNGVTPVRIRGIEIETALRVSEKLSLSAGYTHMDAPEFVTLDNPFTVANDPNRFYTSQVPKHSGNVAIDYNTPFGPGKLRFHMDYAYASSYHPTSAGQLVASFGPNYVRPTAKTSMLNGRIALSNIDVGGSELEVAVFGKNILNKTNIIFGFDGAASGGGFAQYIQEPRTYGLELRVKL